mgnify:CR=1 FL=1
MKMSFKKIMALGLAVIMMMSLLAGCGSSNKTETSSVNNSKSSSNAGEEKKDNQSSKEKSGKEREKIVISCYLADAEQVAVREKYIDLPLQEAFPDVDIEIKMYNDRQSLQVEVAGGGGPDILDLDGPTDVAEFAKADRVMDLTKYAEKYGWNDMFYDWACQPVCQR